MKKKKKKEKAHNNIRTSGKLKEKQTLKCKDNIQKKYHEKK